MMSDRSTQASAIRDGIQAESTIASRATSRLGNGRRLLSFTSLNGSALRFGIQNDYPLCSKSQAKTPRLPWSFVTSICLSKTFLKYHAKFVAQWGWRES